MSQAVLGGLLVVHGLITTMIGFGTVNDPHKPAMAVPSWLAWWPGPFGRSWLFDALGLGSGAAFVGGLLWLVAGPVLVAAGLGWLGVPGVREIWQPLAFIGSAIGLMALALYFHPFYLIAVGIDIAIVVLVWGRLTAAS